LAAIPAGVLRPTLRRECGDHSVDADHEGNGTITDQRLFHLIRQPEPIVDRQFEIALLDPGVEAFAFTFG
jgi:hypothetical protein